MWPGLYAAGGDPQQRRCCRDALQATRRLYVALNCGASLPQALALLIEASSEGPLRRILLQRQQALRQWPRAERLTRWPGRHSRGGRQLLATVDALLLGQSTRQQALAVLRIELLCSRLASCRVYDANRVAIQGVWPVVEQSVAHAVVGQSRGL